MIVLFFSFDIICEALKAEQIYTLLIVSENCGLLMGPILAAPGCVGPSLTRYPLFYVPFFNKAPRIFCMPVLNKVPPN